MRFLSNIFITISFLLISWSVDAQIVVDFSADVVSGCSPLQVAFINESTSGDGYSYTWDLGNGTISNAVNPQSTYISEGTYNVSLTVSYEGNTETLVKEDFVIIYSNPQVNFDLLSDTIGCAPYNVVFENNTVDPQGSEISYTWSFGDGSRSYDKNPSHTYEPAGDFDVTLVAENAYGCTSSFSESKLVHVVQPKAILGVENNTSCTGELDAIFLNNSLARSGYNSYWDFGDGHSSIETSPSHFYDSSGNYTVTLTVTDDIGCSSTISHSGLIEVVKTKADFNMSSNIVCPGQKVIFSNTSEHSIYYAWNLGDGTTSTSESIEKSYSNPGVYEIWLVADNGICKDSIMKTLTVESVKANFKVDNSFICQLPATIGYENLSENGVSYEWKFGSGGTSTSASPVVLLHEEFPLNNNEAVFTDTLTVISEHGCKSTFILKDAVKVVLPKVAMTPNSASPSMSGCIPMELTFKNESTYNTNEDSIKSWSWNIDNGGWQSGNPIQVSATEARKIPVELRVVTHKGCVRSKVETINAGATVDVDFERVGNYERCASEVVVFDITSPSEEFRTKEIWDFGDDSKISLPVPFHNYEKTGKMDVSLTVYNNGCPSKISKSNLLKILGPYAKVTINKNCDDPFLFNFRASVEGAFSYKWDFGDGSSFVTNTLNTNHRYSSSGNYTVVFTAYNDDTGCEYVVTKNVYVRDLESEFSISGTPCLGNSLVLDAAASKDYSPFSYDNKTVNFVWLFEEEGLIETSIDEALTHVFTNKGINHISLVVQDANGCRDTITQEVFIYQPEPDFEADYEVGCMPVTFSFKDLSKSDSPIQKWEWTFGDGSSSADQDPSHEYLAFGSYDVSLQITDNVGCVNKIIKDEAIKAVAPDAGFKADKTRLCVNDDIVLFEDTNSDIVEYLWEISDGRSYTNSEPKLSFSEPGYYSVSLTIIDVHGCEMKGEKKDFFHVQEPPVVDFVADVTYANCYPLVVQFTDLSETPFPGSWTWHFGENDNLSEVQNPFFIYNRPGFHDVKLISRTSYGCTDSIVKTDYIHVGGPYAQIDVEDVVCQFEDVAFKAIDMLNVYDVRWDFGDGYFAEGSEAFHKFQSVGRVYPVMSLRSDEDNTCNKAIRDTLQIWELVADFSFDENQNEGCVPFGPQINNTSKNATNWYWNMGNGRSSTEEVPEVVYDKPGLYNIELIAEYAPLGCKDTMELNNIEVFPLPEIQMHADTFICNGDAIEIWARGGKEYMWSPSETLFEPLQGVTMAAPDENTIYRVNVTDDNGCVNKDSLVVMVQQLPIVYPRDTTLIIGEEVQLDVSQKGISTYIWSPDNFISCAECPDPIFSAMESVSYQVAVTDTSGCFTISYPFNLNVKKIYSVDVPQAFSPNGDGINDVIFVKGWGIKELISFRVFNRFGQVVYESSDLNEGWDGTYKGRAQPMETYTYMVQVKTQEYGVLQKTGTIKLLR